MRRLVLLLLMCGGLGAYEHWITGNIGARYIYRGYSSWVFIQHAWRTDVYAWTVEPATDIVTAVGHNYVSGNKFQPNTSGTLPEIITGTMLPENEYYTCDISGDTFKVVMAGDYNCSDGPTSRLDFTSAGSGTHKMGKYVSGIESNVDLGLTDVPSGVSYEVYCGSSLCPIVEGKARSGWGSSLFYIKFTASPTATLGAATVTATISATAEEDEVIYLPLTVEALTPIPSARPASYPAIPRLAFWEDTMLIGARKFCDPTSYATAASSIGSLGTGVESQIWYYDGSWVYRQVARYTGNADWNNCADYIGNWYRAKTIVDGMPTGYKAFTDGLKSTCASCDMGGRIAIGRILGNQVYSSTCGRPWDFTIRETAYVSETHMSFQHATGTPQTKIQRGAENLLAMFDELFRDNTWTIQQIFYDGLAMRTLIKYWEITRDERVPVAIKTALDWIWTNAWNDTTKQMPYNPANRGHRCWAGCADDSAPWTWTELIPLTLPAYGWYYWYSGDDTYRQRGDEMFKALPFWLNFTGTASTDYLTTIPPHELLVDDEIGVRAHPDGSPLPGGLASAKFYVNAVIDEYNFTVSWSQGGPTVNLTSDGVGVFAWKNGDPWSLDVGKFFSQQFRWSTAYLRWRQGLEQYRP